MTHHPSAASLRLHGARLLFPPVATLLFLVLTEYIARGTLSGDTFVQYIFPHPEAYLLAWGLLFLVWMAVDWLTRFAPLATLLSALLGCLPATVDFYILQLRGEPFLPWDLMQVSEAAGVASAAGIHVQTSMVVSGVVVLALTVGSFFLYRAVRSCPGCSVWRALRPAQRPPAPSSSGCFCSLPSPSRWASCPTHGCRTATTAITASSPVSSPT